jgi:hypothetical protein
MTPPGKVPVQKRKVSLPISAVAVVRKGKGGASVTQTPGAAATSVVSGNVSGTKSFNTSLSGRSLWAEIADQAGKDNSVNVGRLGDRVTWTSTHVTRGGDAFSIQKLTKALGTAVCLPVAIGTSGQAAHNVVFCGERGKAGHEHDGAAHAGLEKWAQDFNDRKAGAAFRADFA